MKGYVGKILYFDLSLSKHTVNELSGDDTLITLEPTGYKRYFPEISSLD